jgi:hypothetical protein
MMAYALLKPFDKVNPAGFKNLIKGRRIKGLDRFCQIRAQKTDPD